MLLYMLLLNVINAGSSICNDAPKPLSSPQMRNWKAFEIDPSDFFVRCYDQKMALLSLSSFQTKVISASLGGGLNHTRKNQCNVSKF